LVFHLDLITGFEVVFNFEISEFFTACQRRGQWMPEGKRTVGVIVKHQTS
jgi:hypothetical protein